MNNKSGVYQLYSISNPNKYYIGSSINIKLRWYSHKYHLKYNSHHCNKLQFYVNKYGVSDIKLKIIELCEESELLQKEQFYIDTLKPYFNECKIAGSILGIKRSPEVCKKISQAKTGAKYKVTYIPTEEHRRKLSIASKGKPKSEQHKKNMRGLFKKGQTVPESTIKAVIEGAKRSWETNREERIAALKRAWKTRRLNQKLRQAS